MFSDPNPADRPLSAGTRDSPLTAHGVIQARRLGAHLAALAGSVGPLRHVFSSDLKRAVETAAALVAAQPGGSDLADDGALPLQLVQLPELRERDFGTAEGKRFGVELALAGAESREQMRHRAEKFVLGHLAPLLTRHEAGGCIVVVSHGLILDSLLRVLLTRFAPKVNAELRDSKATAWSNTGYAELVVDPVFDGHGAVGSLETVQGPGEVSGDRTPAPPASPTPPQRQQISLSIVGVNVLRHLDGLKKTRGGIGSAQFDKRQRTMDSFFAPAAKKAKVEQEPDEP